jgi:hypothetical protein
MATTTSWGIDTNLYADGKSKSDLPEAVAGDIAAHRFSDV